MAFFEYFSVLSSARTYSVSTPAGRSIALLFLPEALNIKSSSPPFSSVFQFFRSNEYSNTFVVQRWPCT